MDGDGDDHILLWRQRIEPAHRLFWRGSLPPQPNAYHRCDVLVIGAGPAGLSSAYFLQQLGYDVLVVENEPLCGGATRTEHWQGAHVPVGALYFAELSGDLQELLQALQLQPLPLPNDALLLEGTIYEGFWRDSVLAELPLPREERSALWRFRTDLQTLPIPPYPLPDPLPPNWRSVAAQPAETFVSAYGSATLLRLLNAYSRSAMGAELSEVSAYCFRDFYSGEFGWEFECPRYSLPGGLAELSRRLCERLGTQRVRLRHLALRCEHLSEQRVRTVCIAPEGEVLAIDADAVVFAGQKFLAKHLIPELPPAQQQAILQLRYAPYLTVHVWTDFPLVPPSCFDLWVPQAQLFTDVVNAALIQSAPVEGFLSCIYVPLAPTQRQLLLDDTAVRRLVRAVVREAFSLLAPECAAESMPLACFAWGHAMVIPTPTALLGAAQQAARPVGRIVFANTDNDASPALENAIEHGLRAAETVHRLLRPHSTRPILRRPTLVAQPSSSP